MNPIRLGSIVLTIACQCGGVGAAWEVRTVQKCEPRYACTPIRRTEQQCVNQRYCTGQPGAEQCRTVRNCFPHVVTSQHCETKRECKAVGERVWVPDRPALGAQSPGNRVRAPTPLPSASSYNLQARCRSEWDHAAVLRKQISEVSNDASLSENCSGSFTAFQTLNLMLHDQLEAAREFIEGSCSGFPKLAHQPESKDIREALRICKERQAAVQKEKDQKFAEEARRKAAKANEVQKSAASTEGRPPREQATTNSIPGHECEPIQPNGSPCISIKLKPADRYSCWGEYAGIEHQVQNLCRHAVLVLIRSRRYANGMGAIIFNDAGSDKWTECPESPDEAVFVDTPSYEKNAHFRCKPRPLKAGLDDSRR